MRAFSPFIGKKIQTLLGGLSYGEKCERTLIQKHEHLAFQPIFIIGLPRSGSTLLYQLLVNNFDLSYFSNLASVFYKYPVTISKYIKNKQKGFIINKYANKSGVTKGLYAPSEAGKIFRYWFNENGSNGTNHIRYSISALSNIYDRPFIWKNLNLSFQIKFINQIFKKPFFIFLNRDLRFVCQSIYLNTINSEGININGLNKSHVVDGNDTLENIISKVFSIDKAIRNDLQMYSNNYIEINYTDLCNDPDETLNSISSSYNKLQPTQKNILPTKINKITETKDVKLAVDKWNHLETLLADRYENIN